MTLKRLIWIDACAALTAVVVLVSFKKVFVSLFNLPEYLFTNLAIVAFCYAIYSFNLACQKNYSLLFVKILAIANAVYALVCLYLVLVFYKTATLLGICYLLLDFIIVATLAYLEGQQYQKYKKL
jgi:CDP-diglyceride synthetase